MKIACHQPYFFPYIGYFQLINAVDIYVNLDHVNYMKRSYMTRNTIKNNIEINIPVQGASQNKKCNEVEILGDNKWGNKFYKTIIHNYKNEPQFEEVGGKILTALFSMNWVKGNLDKPYNQSISNFNYILIKKVCKYLDIKTKLIETSEGLTQNKKADGLIDIVKHFEGDTYINAIGGQELYSKDFFASKGVNLMFIKSKTDLPKTSILDILFRYPKEQIKEELNKFELI